MGLLRKYFNQTRKPEGILGKIMVLGMNPGHAKMADWGLAHLKYGEPQAIVDLGCGGGRNAGALLKKYPEAHVTAMDYSEVSVEKAAAYNKAAIAAGRCEVLQGDVSAIPLGDEQFELATAFETIYFWPGLAQCFGEVARVLKPGGRFLIVNESDGHDEAGKKFESVIDGMRVYTATEIETALRQAGFSEVRCGHHRRKPWIVVLARK